MGTPPGGRRLSRALPLVFLLVVLALLGTLLLTLSPNQPPAQAATQIVFGPQTYERTTGPPNVFTETFSLPTNVGPPFTLHIDNG